jgi:hypothetical protein
MKRLGISRPIQGCVSERHPFSLDLSLLPSRTVRTGWHSLARWHPSKLGVRYMSSAYRTSRALANRAFAHAASITLGWTFGCSRRGHESRTIWRHERCSAPFAIAIAIGQGRSFTSELQQLCSMEKKKEHETVSLCRFCLHTGLRDYRCGTRSPQ